MNPEEVALQPGWMQAVETVAAEAQQTGDYPAIFDDEHLPQTLHRVITTTGLRIETVKDHRHAVRNAAYAVGRYVQAASH